MTLACTTAVASTRDLKAASMEQSKSQIEIKRVTAKPPIGRALRSVTPEAVVVNRGDESLEIEPRLVLPRGVRVLKSNASTRVHLGANEIKTLTWSLQAAQPWYEIVRLELHRANAIANNAVAKNATSGGANA